MNTQLLGQSYHRAIVAVDIEGSTTRTNPVRAQLRRTLYDLLEEALIDTGITDEHRDPLIDRGDGLLVLIHPVTEAPKTVLLSRVIPKLAGLLADHTARHPDYQFRLRAAVHAGDVHYDDRGCYGEDIDITFRLLNSPALKKTLRQTTEPMVLVVSQEIHRSVIRHGYDGIDVHAFDPRVCVQIAGQRVRGWVQIPKPKHDSSPEYETGVDNLLLLAGQELDARAGAPSADPAAMMEQIAENTGTDLSTTPAPRPTGEAAPLRSAS